MPDGKLLGLTTRQISQDLEAARAMEQEHAEDPELLSSWLTPGGTRYYMQVTDIQAASPRFPPSVQFWGVPTRTNGRENFSVLVPVDSPDAIPLDGLPNPIMHNPANRARVEAVWRCSAVWSDQIAGVWGWKRPEVHLQLLPLLPTHGFGGIQGNVVTGELIDANFAKMKAFQPYIENGMIKYPSTFALPIATYAAHLRQTGNPGDRPVKGNFVNNAAEEDAYYGLDDVQIYVNWKLRKTELSMDLMPARMSRLTSNQILASTLIGRDAEDLQWLDDGLQNVFAVSMADFIDHQPEDLPALLMPIPDGLKGFATTPKRDELAVTRRNMLVGWLW